MAHAAETEREVCGVLVGRGERVTRVIRCRNAAEDPRAAGGLQRASQTGYVLDPLELRAIFLDLDRTGDSLLAYYHSHPSFAGSGPSRTDEADARRSGEHRGALFVIVNRGQVRAFAIEDDAVRPIEVVEA